MLALFFFFNTYRITFLTTFTKGGYRDVLSAERRGG
jgi:hypothetical protein